MSKKRKPLTQIPVDHVAKRRNTDDLGPDTPIGNHLFNLKSGTVLEMTLKNFMCHSLLEVRFDSNVTCVVGRNGSGKSAIMTALIIGLGGKASLTNRGNSVKGFIKAGQNSANIRIVLNNGGILRFKPQLYGRFITIERNITASGATAYKIKGENGGVVTTKLREVLNITTLFNIQVDNPICILNQDTARNFLSSSDPKAKYQLFNKATQLEKLFEVFKQGVAKKKHAVATFEEKKRVFNNLLEEIEDLCKKIETCQDLQKLKDEHVQLQKEILWSKVVDTEEEVNRHKLIVEELKQKYSSITGCTENREQRLAEIREKVTEAKRAISELKDSIEQQMRPIRETMRTLDELRMKLHEKNREKRSVTNEMDNRRKERDNLQVEINSFTARMSEIQQKQLEKVKEVNELERKVKDVQQYIDTLQNEMFQSHGDIRKKDEELQEVVGDLQSVKSKHGRMQDQISMLQDKSNNSLAVYGRSMTRLVDAIKRNSHRFSQLPRGPLGSYIKVNKKKWTLAIESYLSGLLHSFCVNNQQDSTLLYQLMRDVWDGSGKPSILTTKFFHQTHNISKNLVEQVDECISIYEAISVSDPVVMNCLIDQLNIEGVLLIPEVDQAIELLSDAHRVPPNCILGITIKGDQFYPDPNYKMYSSKYREARYLQVNSEALLRSNVESLKSLSKELETLQQRQNLLKADLNKRRQNTQEIQNKIDKCKSAATGARMKIVQLQSNDDPDVGDVQQLEYDLVDVNKVIEDCNSKIESITENIAEVQEEIQGHEQKLVKLKDARKLLELRLNPLEEEVKEYLRQRVELDTKEEFEKRRLHECKKKIEASGRELVEVQRRFELDLQQAGYMGERMHDVRSPLALAERIKDVQRAIKQANALNEDINELSQQLKERVAIRNSLKELLQYITTDLQELTTAYEKRKKNYINTRDFFESFVEHCFKQFLKMRKFTGSLKFNFAEKELEMVVTPQQNSGGGVTSTSNLSGGERSFSTVAFLYSLWQCLDFPFYFLDEFDVFMDKVNRTKVMEILMHHAISHDTTQFIFLTPQDVSFINDERVSIHRLEDPERRFTQ